MNTPPNNNDNDKEDHKPMNDSPSQNMILDVNLGFEGRRLAQNHLQCNPVVASAADRGDFPLPDGSYQLTSLGGVSLSSFDCGLSAREKAAFNSREEIEDFLDRLSACTSSKEEDSVKPAASGTASPKDSNTEDAPKQPKTDWDSIFHEAVSQPRSSPTSSAEQASAPATRASEVPMDPTADAGHSLPPSFFTSRPYPNNYDLSSLGLLSLSDPDWLVNEEKATGVANDASLRSLFLKPSTPTTASVHHVPSQPLTFQQFHDARKMTHFTRGSGAEDDRKPAAREVTGSPFDSSSIHTVQSSKSSKSHRSEKAEKEYVDDITDLDVLMGRGGRSNHHPGNHFYLKLIAETKPRYEKCTQKSEKTRVAQYVVDYIQHERKGRFIDLDREAERWYVVDNKKARTKAGQALRDQNTPEARAKKREKYGH